MKSNGGSKLYRRYLFGYLTVVTIMETFLFAAGIYSINNTYHRLSESTQRLMQNLTDWLDTETSSLQEMALSISENPALMPYRIRQNLEQPYLTAREFDLVRTVNGKVLSVGLYYRSSPYGELEDVIFTDTGMYTPDSYSTQKCGGKIDGGQLRRLLGEVSSPRFYSSPLDAPDQQGPPALLMLTPLKGTAFSSGVVVYQLDYEMMRRSFVSAAGGRDNMAAFDKFGMPVCFVENMPGPGLPGLAQFRQSGGGNSRYLTLREESPIYEFQIYSVTDRLHYYREFYLMLVTFAGVSVLSLALGLMVSVRSAKSNYVPIRALADSLPSLSGRDAKPTGHADELDRITQYMEQIKADNAEISRKIVSHDTTLRNQFLLATILGKLNMDNLSPMDEESLEKWFGENRSGSVFVFLFDGYTEIAAEGPSEQWLLKYALCNVFENIGGGDGAHYAMDLAINNGATGIIAWQPGTDAKRIETACRDTAQYLVDFMKDNFAVSISCAVGSPHDAAELYLSYNEALTLSEYRLFLGRGCVILREPEMGDPGGTEDQDIAGGIRRLLAEIRARRADGASRAVQELSRRLIRTGDIARFRSCYLQILFELKRLVNDSPVRYRGAIAYKLDALSECTFETVEEAFANLSEAALSLIHTLSDENTQDKLYASILDYIERHLTDADLSLSGIAEALSLTPSYLTRYFKEKNGLPLMQYVMKIRLDKAKALLRETNQPIKSIVSAVGFVDENNFSRNFKKKEGVPPSQYRASQSTIQRG